MKTLLFGDRTNQGDGLGRLAKTLVDHIDNLTPVSVIEQITPEAQALVHARRDPSLLPALIEHCQSTGQPLLNLATGSTVDLPESLHFLYLECPNISLEVLGFMERVQQACVSVEELFFLHLTEHHQSGKKDRSGTAQSMHDRASVLENCQNQAGYYRKDITSVRDLGETRAAGFNVPSENETGYAIHEAQILSGDRKTELQTFKPLEIYGRQTYAEGLTKVIERLKRIELITGRLHITEFASRHGLI